MTKIKDSVCIITGAASGMGRELAIQAAKRGASRIIATDISPSELAETEKLVAQVGFKLETYVFDIGEAAQINDFVSKILPGLDNKRLVLFNNAGMALCTGRFQDTPLEDFERLMSVNLMGVVRMTKAFYPYFMGKGEGHIINTSSVFGFAGIDGQTAYCTSKFAVRGFSETLRMELYQSNIQVTSVHPGAIMTNIVRKAMPSGEFMGEEDYKIKVEEFDKIAHTSAEKAARQILEAVEKNKTRLVIGFDGKQLDWVTRLFPSRYSGLLKNVLKKKFHNPYE